jgi:hypothetical protein
MTMVINTRLILESILIAATFGSIVAVPYVAAQQMGRDGYRFPSRNPSLAAQFQFQRQNGNGGAAAESAAAGLGALNQFVTTYSSNSTSIGNMNTVTQTLSGGARGSVGQTTEQQSTGNQGSQADTDTSVDNSIISTEAATEANSGETAATGDSSEAKVGVATTTTTTTTTTTPVY